MSYSMTSAIWWLRKNRDPKFSNVQKLSPKDAVSPSYWLHFVLRGKMVTLIFTRCSPFFANSLSQVASSEDKEGALSRAMLSSTTAIDCEAEFSWNLRKSESSFFSRRIAFTSSFAQWVGAFDVGDCSKTVQNSIRLQKASVARFEQSWIKSDLPERTW